MKASIRHSYTETIIPEAQVPLSALIPVANGLDQVAKRLFTQHLQAGPALAPAPGEYAGG